MATIIYHKNSGKVQYYIKNNDSEHTSEYKIAEINDSKRRSLIVAHRHRNKRELQVPE